MWVEININKTKSNNRKGTDEEDEDLSNIDFESLDMAGQKEYLRKLNKNKLDELNTAEQIIERGGKNKALDKNWVRKDDQFPLEKPKEGWDSQMLCYPSLMAINNRQYMFYTGNDFGKTGVGYAEFVEE